MKDQELKIERKLRACNLKMLRIKFEPRKNKFSKLSGLTRPTIDRIEKGDESVNFDSIIIYEHYLTK